ncbi:MAG TPA: Gp37 family protein [Candidatus Binataceae bacterium]|nr:Gp37 family protein [Candidatus Binataceae bacterium]
MGVVLDGPWAGQLYSPPTPIDIGTIEAAIVTRLQTMLPTIEVVHFPDNPKNYRLTHRIGAALIAYRGSEYGRLVDTRAIIQERKLEFEVSLLVRDLGWSVGGPPDETSPGAYALLEAIRAALTGYCIPGARKIYMVRDRFVDRDAEGGVWTYQLSFALVTMAVQPSSTENFPLFIKGLALEKGGETTVTVGATEFTFNSQNEIQLPDQNVVAVTVSLSGGDAFIVGTDFSLDAVNGIVTRLSSGGIASGATVDIAWSYADVAVASQGETAPFV